MVSLALLLVGAPSELLPNPGFEDGEAVPAGWVLFGEGHVSPDGRTGRCVAVTGNGQDNNYWACWAPLEPGGLYRVRFWARAEGSGGCLVSGPALVNRDFFPTGAWQQFAYICRIPDNADRQTLVRFGQWHWKGTVYVDDVSVVPVEALYSGAKGLGEGERIRLAGYRFAAPLEGEGSNHSRPLLQATAAFNSNRWLIAPATTVTYQHDVSQAGGGRQLSALVSVSVGNYSSGSVAVEASRDGVTWVEVGALGRSGNLRERLPDRLFPADGVLVRLRGSPDANLQVVGYTYEAELESSTGDSVGSTAFVEVREQSDGVTVAITGVSPRELRLSVTNNTAQAQTLSASASVGDTPSPWTVPFELAAGGTLEIAVPLHVSRPGVFPVAVRVTGGAGVLSRAATSLRVTALDISDYGSVVAEQDGLTLWTCDATRKVARDRPAPVERSDAGVAIQAAGNDHEPFQLVLSPVTALNGVRVECTDLAGPGGEAIPASRIAVEHVEYVSVAHPSDWSGAPGLWPDPLPPYDGPFDATAGANYPLWIRVYVPEGTPPGLYRGEIRVTVESPALSVSVPVTLRVFGFSLPAVPRVASAFGLSPGEIWRTHNLTERAEQEAVWELYMRNFAEHRLAPYNPMELWPIKLSFEGAVWSGCVRDTEDPYEGRASARVVDDDTARSVDVHTLAQHAVDRTQPLRVAWAVRGERPGQQYMVTLNTFDASGAWIWGRNVDIVREAGQEWREEEVILEPGTLAENAAAVALVLRPVVWTEVGEGTGTAWFDSVFLGVPGGRNLIEDHSFEPAFAIPRVKLDFTEFDWAAERYLDGFGFNAFALPVHGLGSGSFYSRTPGEFGGLVQGTPEYEQLLGDYLGQLTAHLRDKGWLEKAYVYWFDEPDPKDYEFVRDGMERLGRLAPGLRRMLTEQPEDELVGAVDVWCALTPEFHLEKAQPRMEAGDEFWWYFCTAPKAPWCGLFIDHPATDLRVWLWQTFGHKVQGILVWHTNYWTSPAAYPDEPQDPWTDPMSYVSGYGFQPGFVGHWGNGDGRFLYPPNRDLSDRTTKYVTGPVNSLRWEMLREGMEDYEYLRTLQELVTAARAAGRSDAELDEAARLLQIPSSIYASMTEYTTDPTPIYEHRARVGEAIERLVGTAPSL